MNKLIALVLVFLVVVFLFVYISSQKSLPLFTLSSSNITPSPTSGGQTLRSSGQATSKAQNTTEQNTIVNLKIENNRLTDGPPALQVTQGAMVILHITSDSNGLFDFPGYDQHVSLMKNKTVTLSFLANHVGHFEYKSSGTTLGAIDVYPQ